MDHFHFDRLSVQDNDFLRWETPALPMHGSGISIFEEGPLATREGGVDFAAIKAAMASVLHHVPRYRQKLVWIPGEEHAVWVDDARFNLDYHMRHVALPRPGSEAQLKRMAADIMERPLDRGRPLWETWVIEGLQGGRFALIAKAHHCMVDGASGMSLMQHIFQPSPEVRLAEAPRFLPRPPPTAAQLRRASQRRRLDLPARALRELGSFVRESADLRHDLAGRLRALGELARMKLVPASETPLNGEIGPHRIFDWLELPLDALKAVRHAEGCSINDVVLASVSGAVRELMIARQLRPEELDFRVSAPVNVRGPADRERLGNHVSSWIVRLPVGLRDPLEQLRVLHETTQALKDSNQALGVEMATRVREWLSFDVQALSKGTQNMLVTNVPGPAFPLYMLGAKMLALYAQAPLIKNIGLAVSAISYNGAVGFGFNADYDRLPDLAEFARQVGCAFERLAKAARSPRATGDSAPARRPAPPRD